MLAIGTETDSFWFHLAEQTQATFISGYLTQIERLRSAGRGPLMAIVVGISGPTGMLSLGFPRATCSVIYECKTRQNIVSTWKKIDYSCLNPNGSV